MSNLSQTTKVVKEFEEKTHYFLRFLLQDEAQKIISSAFPNLKSKAFCSCHKRVITPSSVAQVHLNTETRRAYWHRVATCANAMLCPICAPRIAAYRCNEIASAAMQHLRSDPENRLYLLTLTCRHTSADQIADLLSSFKAAQSYFFGLTSIQRAFYSLGSVGRITSHEVTYNLGTGFHPHSHILIFGRAAESEIFSIGSGLWLKSLRKFGLSGVEGIAFDLRVADDYKSYLTKISQELVMQHLKQGRARQHFTPMQLLHEASFGYIWARFAFASIFDAYAGRHLLHWSRGLKTHFGIGNVSDESIANNNAEAARMLCVLEIPRKIYNSFSHYKRAEILRDVSNGDYSKVREFLCSTFSN